MTALIPGLTVVKRPLETYLIVRERDGDRELTRAECGLLLKAAQAFDKLQAIHSGLDDALGDLDYTHIDDEDELRLVSPGQWAAQKIAEIINAA